MVLQNLDKYKEVVDRDRFVIPINNCVNFFN